jgi:hypothetical protein
VSDFEKYVDHAAEAGWESIRPTYWVDAKDDGTYEAVPCWADADEADKESCRKVVRAELAVVGPLIAEDTRERMVAAAARAVERETRRPLIASDDPFTALQNVLAFSSNDWGSAGDFAWLYGIILGWDADEPGEESSMQSLAAKYGWSEQQVELLRSLHLEFEAAAETYRCAMEARP